MDILKVYESFSDVTRLRVFHLLTYRKSLCVCHLQSVLQEPQVKISRHLAYLRRRELVEVTQEGNWRYYSLPKPCTKELRLNLKCLRMLAAEHATFKRDLKRLEAHVPEVKTCASC